MEREIFNQIGEALYGLSWLSLMAEHLRVPINTVYGWSVAIEPIPESVRNELYKALRERGNTILMLIGELED